MTDVRRREFITLLGGTAAAWPLAARAQQAERVRRIGVLTPFNEGDPEVRSRVLAFQEALREAGWVEGRNIRIDYRWAAGDLDRIRAYAVEIVGLAPEAILGASTPVLAALRKETPNHTDCIHGGLRSRRRRLCCESGATGRQSYRICEFRTGDGREVAAGTQTGGAERQPRCIHSESTECQLGQPLSSDRGRRPDIRRDRERD